MSALSHHLSSPYSFNYEDYKAYLSCPKKVAFRVMGIRSHTVTSNAPKLPVFEIGLKGEELTEQMLILIQSVQHKLASRGSDIEPSEVASELSDETSESFEGFGEVLDVEESAEEELDAGVQEIRRVKKTLLDRVGENVRLLARHLPRILTVTRPRYRNRDVFASGLPDFQVETVGGHYLVEVKNLRDPSQRSINDALLQTRFYLAMLKDKLVSDAVLSTRSVFELFGSYPRRAARLLGIQGLKKNDLWETSQRINLTMPPPPQGLVFLPRQTRLEVVERGLDEFRTTAVEIWKIKRAAFADRHLPYVERVPELCRRCAFKKRCKEGTSLEAVAPAPLAFAAGEAEVGMPKQWSRFQRLREKLDEQIFSSDFPIEGFGEDLALADRLVEQARETFERKRLHAIYREFPQVFDQWGGEGILRDPQLKRSTHLYYRMAPESIEGPRRPVKGERPVLRRVRKRWNV